MVVTSRKKQGVGATKTNLASRPSAESFLQRQEKGCGAVVPKVYFAETALLDLDAIEAYIAQDSPENASRFILQLDETCHLLG